MLSLDPFNRRIWNVFSPDPGVRSKSVYFGVLGLRRAQPTPINQSQKDLIADGLAAAGNTVSCHRLWRALVQ